MQECTNDWNFDSLLTRLRTLSKHTAGLLICSQSDCSGILSGVSEDTGMEICSLSVETLQFRDCCCRPDSLDTIVSGESGCWETERQGLGDISVG